MMNITRFLVGALMLCGLVSLQSGCTPMSKTSDGKPLPPVRTVERLDLPRYMGDWYVIANIPYFAEKNCLDSLERYVLRKDGKIDNTFFCRKKSLDAPLKQKASALGWVHDKRTNAEWRVRFFGLISTKYLVLGLDDDYQWSAVGHPSRKYGWVLARSKALPDESYRAALKVFAQQGYDTSRFVKVPQKTAADAGTAQ